MTNFRLFQTQENLQKIILGLMKMADSFPGGLKKHYWKRRNCSLRAISPFPIVFSKDLYIRYVKDKGLLRKALIKDYPNSRLLLTAVRIWPIWLKMSLKG